MNINWYYLFLKYLNAKSNWYYGITSKYSSNLITITLVLDLFGINGCPIVHIILWMVYLLNILNFIVLILRVL